MKLKPADLKTQQEVTPITPDDPAIYKGNKE